MHAREFRVGSSVRPPEVPADVPELIADLAREFVQLPDESIRFIFQDASWRLFEFQKAHDSRSAVVRFQQLDPPFGITSRELDVLTLVALGLSNQSIARRLGNSARTVSTQVETLLHKMGQESRTALAVLAVEQGYMRLPLPGGPFPSLSVPSHVRLQNALAKAPKDHAVSVTRMRLEPGPVTIGIVTPDGQAQSDGRELFEGAQLAVEEINLARKGSGARQLRLLAVSADLFDPASVGRAFSTLLGTDVDALITSYVATEDLTVLEPVAEAGIPFLHTATQYSQIERVEQNRRRYGNFFQTCPPETFYGREFIDVLESLELAEKWKAPNRTFVSVDLDTATTSITTNQLVDYAALHGWSLASHIRVKNTGVDWDRVIAQISREDPAMILLTHFLPNEVIEFYRKFLDSGLTSLLMSVYGPSIMHFQEEFGERANGVLWSTTSGTYADMLGTRFRNGFSKRYGKLPGWSQAGAAYDQIHLLTRAWQAGGTVDPGETIENLRKITHRGVNGTYYLGGRGQTSLAYPYVTQDPSLGLAHMVYQIQSGTSRPIGPAPYGDVSAFRIPSWV